MILLKIGSKEKDTHRMKKKNENLYHALSIHENDNQVNFEIKKMLNKKKLKMTNSCI